jgi:hypothetical protein
MQAEPQAVLQAADQIERKPERNPADHLRQYRYAPGEDGKRRRSRLFLELYGKAEAELGSDLTATEAMMSESAVGLFVKAERTKSVEQKVHVSQCAGNDN